MVQTMKRFITGMLILLMNVGLTASCTTGLPTDKSEINSAKSQRDTASKNKRIRELLKTFSEDVGPVGLEAFRNLQAEPKFMETLLELQGAAPPSDRVRPQIAFVFCWLDRNYESNVKVIESALSKSSPYEGLYAGDAQMMLSRLIQRGKKDLLKPLLQSMSFADGDLAEGLGDTFARELQSDPEQFLTELSAFPADTRKDVYYLIHPSDSFTDKELSNLRRRLSSIPSTSNAYKPAKELLPAWSSKASNS
jgi:hypothetical protein